MIIVIAATKAGGEGARYETKEKICPEEKSCFEEQLKSG